MESKTILNNNLVLFMREFQEHVQQGWEIDSYHPPDMHGFAYEVGLVRTDKTIAALAGYAQGQPPKMTREQAAAKAREALAASRAEKKGKPDGQ